MRCSKCGHEYPGSVANRFMHSRKMRCDEFEYCRKHIRKCDFAKHVEFNATMNYVTSIFAKMANLSMMFPKAHFVTNTFQDL
jgi:hypothetical protein